MVSPPVIIGTGSRAWASADIALAALQHASAGKPFILRSGDCPTGADVLLKTAALRLGWRTQAFRADWRTLGRAAGPERNSRLVAAEPKAATAVALFAAALRNAGTLDCSGKILAAGIPLSVWCDECGPVPLTEPCEEHSLAEVREEWRKRAQRAQGGIHA